MKKSKQHTYIDASSIPQSSTPSIFKDCRGPSGQYAPGQPSALENEPHRASFTQSVIRIHVFEGWTAGLVVANNLLYEDAPTSFLTCPMADRRLGRGQLSPQDLQKGSHQDVPREGRSEVAQGLFFICFASGFTKM